MRGPPHIYESSGVIKERVEEKKKFGSVANYRTLPECWALTTIHRRQKVSENNHVLILHVHYCVGAQPHTIRTIRAPYDGGTARSGFMEHAILVCVCVCVEQTEISRKEYAQHNVIYFLPIAYRLAPSS